MIPAVLLWAVALVCGWAANLAVERLPKMCVPSRARLENLNCPSGPIPSNHKPLLLGSLFPVRRRGFFLLAGMALGTIPVYCQLDTGVKAFLAVLILACLLTLAVTDQQRRLLPDKLVLTLAVLSALWIACHFSMQVLLFHLLSALIGGGVFYLVALVTKGAVGGGDIKLMACCGLLLGPGGTLLMAVFMFAAAGAVAAVLLAARRKSLKDAIPLGPYMCLGTALALLFAPDVWAWYWEMILR